MKRSVNVVLACGQVAVDSIGQNHRQDIGRLLFDSHLLLTGLNPTAPGSRTLRDLQLYNKVFNLADVKGEGYPIANARQFFQAFPVVENSPRRGHRRTSKPGQTEPLLDSLS